MVELLGQIAVVEHSHLLVHLSFKIILNGPRLRSPYISAFFSSFIYGQQACGSVRYRIYVRYISQSSSRDKNKLELLFWSIRASEHLSGGWYFLICVMLNGFLCSAIQINFLFDQLLLHCMVHNILKYDWKLYFLSKLVLDRQFQNILSLFLVLSVLGDVIILS